MSSVIILRPTGTLEGAIVSEFPKRFGLDEYEPIKPVDSFIRDWNTLGRQA